jgi:hypothetical protein
MPNAAMLIKPLPAKRKHAEYLEYMFPGIADASVALQARGNNGVVSVGDAVVIQVIRTTLSILASRTHIFPRSSPGDL